jgi:hypothetical protein
VVATSCRHCCSRTTTRGDLKNFTGIDSPCEASTDPELRIDMTDLEPEDAAEQVIQAIAWRILAGSIGGEFAYAAASGCAAGCGNCAVNNA